LTVNDEQVSFSMEINVDQACEDIRRVQTVIYRTLGLMRRMGLPENIDIAINKIQKMIAVLNMVRLAMIALYAASGPIGWALALIGVVGTAVTAGDFLMELW